MFSGFFPIDVGQTCNHEILKKINQKQNKTTTMMVYDALDYGLKVEGGKFAATV